MSSPQAKGLPICQDTGMAVVFVDWGQDCHLTGGSLEDAVNDGVARGYGRAPAPVGGGRPLRRGNTNNTPRHPPSAHGSRGDRVDLTVAPKGFKQREHVQFTDVQPLCHPGNRVGRTTSWTVCGQGRLQPLSSGDWGGRAALEVAAELTSGRHCGPVGEHHPDPYYAGDGIAHPGAGQPPRHWPPLGGGTTTALCESIYTCGTHIAGLPCAVNPGLPCHLPRP